MKTKISFSKLLGEIVHLRFCLCAVVVFKPIECGEKYRRIYIYSQSCPALHNNVRSEIIQLGGEIRKESLMTHFDANFDHGFMLVNLNEF